MSGRTRRDREDVSEGPTAIRVDGPCQDLSIVNNTLVGRGKLLDVGPRGSVDGLRVSGNRHLVPVEENAETRQAKPKGSPQLVLRRLGATVA
jgi:hypothetical protein